MVREKAKGSAGILDVRDAKKAEFEQGVPLRQVRPNPGLAGLVSTYYE